MNWYKYLLSFLSKFCNLESVGLLIKDLDQDKWHISAYFLLADNPKPLSLRICWVYPILKIVVLAAHQAILINIDNGYGIWEKW